MKVLIVEDEALSVLYFTDILEQAGHEVTGSAASVEEALIRVSERRPDLVLLDYRLHGPVTGATLGSMLTSMDIPVIYITGNVREVVMETRDHAVAVLGKPLAEDELLGALAKARRVFHIDEPIGAAPAA
jgi:two-component system, response regulator PdtaR